MMDNTPNQYIYTRDPGAAFRSSPQKKNVRIQHVRIIYLRVDYTRRQRHYVREYPLRRLFSLSLFLRAESFFFSFSFGGGWRTFISSFFFFLNVSFNPTLFLSAGTLPTGAARMKPDPPPAIVAISFEIVRIQNKKVPGNVNFFPCEFWVVLFYFLLRGG
jgi:hypothetical protein